MDIIKLKIEGDAQGILLQNPRSCDPLDSFVKYNSLHPVNKNTRPTLQDYENLAVRSWFSGIYTDIPIECSDDGQIICEDNTQLIIPADMMQSCFRSGASKTGSLGKKFTAGVLVTGDAILKHDKSSLPLSEQCNICFLRKSVVINRNRVMSTRPLFHRWSIEAEIHINTNIISKSDAMTSIKNAGILCGMGVWRPNSPKPGIHGRFSVEEI